MPNKKRVKAFSKKAVICFVAISIILWSIGVFLFPVQLTFAQDFTPPQPTGQGGPPNGQTGAPVDAFVDRVFNESLAVATVNTDNVLLQTNTGNTQEGAPTGNNLCTSASLQNNTQIICNHASLTSGTWYTFTVTTGVTDLAENHLASDFTATFQTSTFGGGTKFNPPPFVIGTIPSGGGTLPLNGKITVSFTRTMKTSGDGSVLNVKNIQLFLTSQGAPTGSNLFLNTTGWTFDTTNNQLKITPPTLIENSYYRLIVKGFQNFNPNTWDTSAPSCGSIANPCVLSTDVLPIPGPDFIVDFQATAADNSGSTMVGSSPDNNVTSVDRATFDFAVSMNEGIDPSTVLVGTTTGSGDGTVLMLRDDGDSTAEPGDYDLTTEAGEDTVIATGSASLDPDLRVIHYSPNAILNSSAKHFLILRGGASGIKDLVGNAMAADIVRTFTTGTNVNGQATDNTAPRVEFANADNFGIFITFSEAVKFGATANVSESTSDGVNDANNLSNWTLETSADGTNWMSVNLTGKSVRYESWSKTLELEGLALPPNNYFKVTGSTNIQDLSDNALASANRIAQGTVKNSSDTGGQLGPGGTAGGPNFFEMGTRPISVFPKSAMAGVTTRYKVEFPADTAIPASGKITLTYPSGFSFATACNTWLTDTFENADINGPATGTVTVASISCDSVSRVVTITLGSVATQAGDMIRFEIQGVVNSTVPKDFSTSGYTVDIKTYDASNVLLESKTSMPFFIALPGTNTIQGKVFVDANSNGTLNEGESGVNGTLNPIKVCLGGPMGFDCKTIDASGDYSFAQLPDSFYHLDIPPISSGDYSGGPFSRDINVSGGQTVTENFAFQPVVAKNILDVYVTGGAGLANQKLDVFAFSSSIGMTGPGQGMPGPGSFVVRELTLNGSGIGETDLPLSTGKWQVGVGPWMPKDPGAPPPPPDFTFMPPKPVEVSVDATTGVPDLCTSGAGAANELCFTLTASVNQIKGKVVDGSGNAISNAFVMARPAFFDPSAPPAAGVAMSDTNGLFNIKVVTGTYIVDASMPGMPPSNSFECTVKDNTAASDNNATADVYCAGILIVNDVAGFSGSAITGTITDNDLILKIAKGDTSISGRVLDDDGNAIPFAHINGMEVDDSGNPFGGWVDSPSDNSGNYTLYVAGGTGGTTKKWKIRAFAPGFGELPSITVAVAQGQNLTGKNLQVVAGQFYTVSGQVTQAGTAIQGVFVGAHGLCGGNGTVTDTSGNYTLKLRATGSCTSTAGDNESYTIEGFLSGQGPTSVLTGIEVTGNLTGKDLTMAQPGTVVVYLCSLDAPLSSSTDSTKSCSDRKVGNAFVDARDSQGRGNGTSSNPTMGVYEIVVPAGSYTIKAQEPAAGYLGSATITVVGGATRYVNIEPPALYTVQGTVTSSDSACIEGATAILSDSVNGRVILARVISDGSWSVSNVPVGAYSVGVGKPGCVDSADPGIVNVTGIGGDTYTVATRTLVKADATISGRVTLDGSNVSFETMVFATSSGGKKVVTKVDTSQSGTNNNYTLSLTAGAWTVQARSDGYQSSAASVTVSSGGSATQNLQLTAIAGYTRKEPKPYGIKPSRGGIVKNSEISGDFEINIPAGVLGTSSNDGSVLTKETTAVANTATQNIIGDKGIEVTPKDASGQPIETLSSSSGSTPTITIPYSESDVTAAGTTEGKIVIGAWSDEKQQWDPLPTTCDTTNNKCTATISHFSTFALLTPSGGGVPSTPTGLTATTVSTSRIDLSWDAVTGATSYDIYRDTSDSGDFPRLGSEPTVSGGSTTSYSDTGLTASTTYYYKISALNSSGESAASSAVSATTSSAGGGGGVVTGDFNPPSISEIKVSAASNSATITWKTDESSISWIVYGLTTDYDKEIKTTTYTTSHSVVLSELSPSITYHYQIKSKDSAGNVGSYTDQTFTTLAVGEVIEIPKIEKPITEMTIEELKAKIAEIQAMIAQLQAQLSQLQAIPEIPADYKFEKTLKYGQTSDDVKYLQIFLKAQGPEIYPEGLVTGYFGPLTKAAVIKFQEKYTSEILAPWDLTEGTGIVGETTRAKINEILGR